MQQEDDLRALAKIMEFGRAEYFSLGGARLCVLLSEYHRMEPELGGDRPDSGELQQHDRHFQLHPLDQAAGCDLTGNILPGYTWSQG